MTRAIKDLGYEVFDDVLYTIELFQSRYDTKGYHDSGHTKGRPTWIYDFPHYGGAQVGIPLNKECLTLYLRDKTQSGPLLSEILPEGVIEKRYPADGKPAGSVGRAAYLAPSGGNRLLKVNLPREDVLRVLDAYFGVQTKPESQAASYSGAENPITRNSIPRRRPNGAISAEEFENQLDRKSEIGKAGELIAVLDELERLRSRGCPEPEKYVNRVALTDIGRGYDIESVWPNEKRYIEVKSSTSLESDFYISDNERKTLAGLGDAAWLYRVHVLEGGQGTVTKRVQNPMNAIAEEAMSPVVWRVSASALK